jgi:apolipoprotein D and lipocalin family protein
MRLVLAALAAAALAGCAPSGPLQSASPRVAAEPQKPVDLARYAGRWYELGRYEAFFQRGCEAVTADYAALPDGRIKVVNACRAGAPDGPLSAIEGVATPVPGARGAKLKVSFFGPFAGDYWVMDHAPDYSWSIVGDGSGRYLWLLSRQARPGERAYQALLARAAALGFDPARVRRTRH